MIAAVSFTAKKQHLGEIKEEIDVSKECSNHPFHISFWLLCFTRKICLVIMIKPEGALNCIKEAK